MAVHSCIRCPLRFRTRAELTDHLDHDHHVPAGMLGQYRYPEADAAEPLYRELVLEDGVHTILLIANQTLGSTSLLTAMRRARAHHDRLTVFVLVPATPQDHLVTGPGGGRPAAATEGLEVRTDDAGVAQARWRLRSAVTALTGMGIAAHGRIGDPNPVTAAAGVIAAEPIDEILVSTLDPQMSRWLHQDLPATLERRFGLPVTTLVDDRQPLVT